LASLLSVQGFRIVETFEARNALLTTNQTNPSLQSYLHHHSRVVAVTFSPEGKTLASGSADATVRLWDVTTRQPLGDPLRGHSKDVLSVAFSPDGKTLASASQDGTVRLWDVATHHPRGEPTRPNPA
jgi:WD40 repeat protein